ncbi:MAG: pilus assembly protein [Pseudomonadota bacterium]
MYESHLMTKRCVVFQRSYGFVLISSLIILVVLSLLALSSAETTLFEERMASNLKNRNIALQSAESALIDAENYLNGLIEIPMPTTLNSPDQPRAIWHTEQIDSDVSNTSSWWFDNNLDWWQKNAKPLEASALQSAQTPQYIIETKGSTFLPGTSLLDPNQQVFYYRITSRAEGDYEDTPNKSHVILQSTYARRFE